MADHFHEQVLAAAKIGGARPSRTARVVLWRQLKVNQIAKRRGGSGGDVHRSTQRERPARSNLDSADVTAAQTTEAKAWSRGVQDGVSRHPERGGEALGWIEQHRVVGCAKGAGAVCG